MKTDEIIAAVKRHRGPIFVEVSLNDDICYFQVSKPETLYRLETIGNGQAGYHVKNGDFVIGRGYGDE